MDKLTTKSETIESVYDWYIQKKLIVNRKYQRKLVWTIEEKALFIDSIQEKYSVPLFLFANKVDSQVEQYEIIDGMQRLNAIFSFIEGEFSINTPLGQGFFNLDSMPTTRELLKNKLIYQKQPILNAKVCTEIIKYQLPFSMVSYKDEKRVEEIFRRINSYGRHLSKQEIRQAGALGLFPKLIRLISSGIRRDSSSSDILPLQGMKEISLSNKKLPYGIDMNSVFWVKQKIIPITNMRVSRDEELIAYLLTYILTDETTNPSAATLDKIYKYDIDDSSNLAKKVENKIDEIGFDNLFRKIEIIFNELEKVLSFTEKDFRALLFDTDGEGLVRTFQIVFLALYELIILDNKFIKDYEELVKSLDGLGKKHLGGVMSKDWDGKYRKEKIQSIKGILDKDFSKSLEPQHKTNNHIGLIENLLSQSKIEQQLFELKIGFHDLKDNKFNKKLFSRIIKTLTAMANTDIKAKGYVIIGIADDENASSEYKSKFKKSVREFNGFVITGIQDEAISNHGGADSYFNKIKQFINDEPIDPYANSYITRNMRLITYYDKELLLLEIEAGDTPLIYNNKYYERQGANLAEIEPANFAILFNRFTKR